MKRKTQKILSVVLAVMMFAAAIPATSTSALSLTCPGTGGWSSMEYDETTGNTIWNMKDGSIIVQDKNGNVIQNTQNATSTPSVSQPTASSGWTSDTNSDFTVQPGKTYQFKFTAANPGALNVWFGTPGVFTIQKSGQEAGAVYYKITAVGTPGAAAGIYVSYNGSSGTKLCVATVAGGSSATGQPTTPEAPSKPNVDTTNMTEAQRLSVEAGLTLGDWSHEYEQGVLEYTNEERVKAGLEPLVWSRYQTENAQIRAKEISTYYSHDRLNGEPTIWENISMAGESVGVHYENGQRILTRIDGDPKSVVQGWMNSEGHRANILNPNATSMAVGCYVAENGNIYWVQCFDSSTNELINPITVNPLLKK